MQRETNTISYHKTLKQTFLKGRLAIEIIIIIIIIIIIYIIFTHKST